MAKPGPKVTLPPRMLQLAERLFRQSSDIPASEPQFLSPLRGLRLLRHDKPTGFEATIYEPVVCLILQGQKETSFGDFTFRMRAGECLLVSHDLPVVSRIIEAPYMALLLDVQVDTVRSLYEELQAPLQVAEEPRALEVHPASPAMLDALDRYLALSESAADAKVLGPMLAKEVHYRLLTAPIGGMLRSLIHYDSYATLVARAISLIRRDFRADIGVAELARQVGMSVSSFHRHFKAVTYLSPLQYQKELRLLEARRLLTSGGESVTSVALGVGYESLSQFSREYSRKFGKSPQNDLPNVAAREPRRRRSA